MLNKDGGVAELDYAPCYYGRSKLKFRGPMRPMPRDYVAFVGSTETYGKFVARPFPALVEEMTRTRCLNLGSANAGLDSFIQDPTVISLARNAQMVVLQVMGPQFMSNRFYSVHPRRNDRFIKANAPLKRLYPSIDFTEFTFVGHLIRRLQKASPRKFQTLRQGLQQNWVQRMNMAVQLFARPVVLLWLDEGSKTPADLLDRQLLSQLETDRVEVLRINPDHWVSAQGLEGMIFDRGDARAAHNCLSFAYHRLVAQTVTPFVQRRTR
ncbi:hypothetical protein TG4357_03264 [Thalassovita gelatinovora]|uniref:DUF6473 domain-containing protein n=1 Tax=Thalassovita gelatinovora TaxID=53501 RepID=A0A0P1G6W9_THAGE|nr:DUF6473 family protein [Thalassovita gelatinovora]QIZ81514.1 hypothetical protein HFZ77_14010 [Thalassovita gelatinovora]CUH67888.1 hypothetical protein TG4357_03264 [Thalassovita gelatinovora]SEQ24933.1 hypothetical protein SAMN04488043_104135 [Thalassovita gelatinovora]